MIIKLLKNHWPVLAITAVVLIFFSKLFFPPSIFVTPDYGRSDILHFNIPVKEILSQSLRKGQLPLWEPRIGQGFPVFDEGQAGALFLPNIILFGLLPFWLAFDLGYIVTFMTAAFGAYLLTRSLKLSKVSSYLAAITFAFSAIFVLHIEHYNLIQTASLMPWLFWLFNEFMVRKRLIYLAILPFLISQQIFTGFPQMTFYSLFGLLIFAIYKIFQTKATARIKLLIFTILCVFILLGFLISAVQLNATYNLVQTSKRILHNDPAKILTDFPLTPKNLSTVINPYILGSPQNGKYFPWQPGNWSVFWESNVYFGIVQLLLAASLIPFFVIQKKWQQKSNVLFWAAFGLLGLLLALGTSAPLYPIFTFPIFSYFRVPARFLIFVFLSAGILAGVAIDMLLGKRPKKLQQLLVGVLIIFATLDIFRIWSTYHATGTTGKWLSQPDIASSIPQNQRVYAWGQGISWNSTFLNKGWVNPNDYLFFFNFIAQNANITSNKSQTLVYAGMSPNRNVIIEGLLDGELKAKGNKLEATTAAQNILDMTSTQFLTTPFIFNSEKWQLVNSVQNNNHTIYLYKNRQSLPHAFVAKNWQTATTVQDFLKNVSSEEFKPQDTVILEKQPSLNTLSGSGSVALTNYQNTKVTLQANLLAPSLVVLTDSYYPGWQAKVDGISTEVLAANINSRAVAVNKGSHIIEYTFEPKHFKLSVLVSIVSLLLSLAMIIKLKNKEFNL